MVAPAPGAGLRQRRGNGDGDGVGEAVAGAAVETRDDNNSTDSYMDPDGEDVVNVEAVMRRNTAANRLGWGFR